MGRGKLSMKLISNEKSRKTTFCKRKTSLMKKASELSILCDVRTCVFVYGPSHNDQSPVEVDTWPPSRDEVNKMIASYKANCLHKRARKAFGLLDFFSERKKKTESDMSKLRKDVVEARFPKWDESLDCLSEDQLRLLMVELDSKLDASKRRIESITENLEKGMSAAGSNQQTLNANMKQKQVMSFEEQCYGGMFGSSLAMETQPIIPYHHQLNQIQTMAQNFQMGSSVVVPKLQIEHDHHQLADNFSQYLFGSNGSSSSTQIQFNYGNFFQSPHFYSDYPTNRMIMESTQNYSLCHYGIPVATQSIMPLSHMHHHQQLTDDQMMLACASNSQMGLLPNSSAQVDDQFDTSIMSINSIFYQD